MSHRLPADVRPKRYLIHLDADPARPDFTGTVRIEVEAASDVPDVRLHARALEVDRATLEQDGSRRDVAVEVDAQEEQLVLKGPLRRGAAVLEIAYRGKVSPSMQGLYFSKDGPDQCLATQCEATDARAFLPCFDEPAFKAHFEWRVTSPAGTTVLTNGEAREAPVPAGVGKEGRVTWSFLPVGPMSSYLLAMVMGRFEPSRTDTERGVAFRVWALGGKQHLGAEAQALAVRLLGWYEDYFGQPYAWGKYDQVAVPSFAFGAMENAGLVTFRPSLLLIDPARSTWDERKDVALVVAHEFAHMWFGNLVTMAWWDDLWLNEAFAEWMAHRATHALQPDLDVWVRFRQRAYGALSTDSLDSTHAIYHPVQTAAEAQEMFDAITYGKGSAVMRMLEAFLGEEAFREGLRTYMAEFRFRNARGSDLWTHLGRASGRDVAAIMSAWVTQKGHPVVHVAFGSGRLVLRQRRARSSPAPEAAPAAVAADDVWPVPMVVRYEDDAGVQTHPVLLEAPEASVELPVQGRLRWLWPNAGDVGFFRCALDDHLLGAALHGRLEPEEQVALLRDLWGQVKAGQAAPEAFLRAFERIASTLGPHARYDLVGHVVASLRTLEALLESAHDEDAVRGLRHATLTWLAHAYHQSGQPRTPADRKRRASLLRALAGIGHDERASTEAHSIGQAERQDPGAVDPDLATAAVAVEAILGDAGQLETHLGTYKARRDANAPPQLVERYLYVLGAFRRPELVARVLQTLDSGEVAPQAVGPILRGMLSEPHSARAAWAFLTSRWDTLKARLGEAWTGILVEGTGEVPVDLAPEVIRFWDANLGGSAQQSYARAKERLATRREFESRVVPRIAAWARELASLQVAQR